MQRFFSCLLSYLHFSITCSGLTRPFSEIVTLTKILSRVERVVTFNKNPLKFLRCWYLLIASSAHCQLCVNWTPSEAYSLITNLTSTKLTNTLSHKNKIYALIHSNKKQNGPHLCRLEKKKGKSRYFSETQIKRAFRIQNTSQNILQTRYSSSIPVAPTWSIGHPWNASFHFSFLI
jgi:hypothetical protein